jgi:hypothetical protein
MILADAIREGSMITFDALAALVGVAKAEKTWAAMTHVIGSTRKTRTLDGEEWQ